MTMSCKTGKKTDWFKIDINANIIKCIDNNINIRAHTCHKTIVNDADATSRGLANKYNI